MSGLSLSKLWRLLPLAVAAASTGGAAAPTSPVVIELFQSQGCSSCPPANANVIGLTGRRDVLPLSFGVTYWDHLGWKDGFATPEYTQRQRDYAHARGRQSVWTPQVYINGRADIVGNKRPELEAAIARARSASTKGPAVSASDRAIAVAAATAPKNGADVWLVRYDPRTVDVPIRAGENGGRTLPHRNVVRQLVKLGRWTGAPVRFDLPAAPQSGLRTAALVQAGAGGPIIAAATT